MVRRNGVDDSAYLPRFMVVNAGPLSKHAISADASVLAVHVSAYNVTLKLPGHLGASVTLHLVLLLPRLRPLCTRYILRRRGGRRSKRASSNTSRSRTVYK